MVIGWAFQIGVPTAAGYFAKDINQRAVAMSAWAMSMLAAVPLALLLIPFYRWQLSGPAFQQGGPGLQRWYYAFIALQLFNGPFLSAIFRLRGSGSLKKFNVLLALPHVLVTGGYLVLFVLGRLTVSNALASTFCLLSAGWAIGLTSTRSWPGRGFSRVAFRKIKNYSLQVWVGNLSTFASFRVDQLLLVNFVSLEQLGIYAVASAIATLSGPVARGFSQGLLPFVRHAPSDHERLGRISSTLRQVAIVSFVVLFALAGLASFAIPFILPASFAGVVLPLMILLPGAWAADVTQVLTMALTSFNRPSEASKAQVFAGVTTAIGLAVLLPRFGIIGAAWTTTVAYWVGLIANYMYWRRTVVLVKAGVLTGNTIAIDLTNENDLTNVGEPVDAAGSTSKSIEVSH